MYPWTRKNNGPITSKIKSRLGVFIGHFILLGWQFEEALGSSFFRTYQNITRNAHIIALRWHMDQILRFRVPRNVRISQTSKSALSPRLSQSLFLGRDEKSSENINWNTRMNHRPSTGLLASPCALLRMMLSCRLTTRSSRLNHSSAGRHRFPPHTVKQSVEPY